MFQWKRYEIGFVLDAYIAENYGFSELSRQIEIERGSTGAKNLKTRQFNLAELNRVLRVLERQV